MRALALNGTASEPHYDAVCRTAQALFRVPISLVSLVDEHEQWFKARCGLAVESTPRDVSFCTHAILSDAVLVVEDAALDERFAANPLVTGAPHIRFYAGAPLILRPGLRVGTLCIIDTRPRGFSREESRQLQDLAQVVVAHLHLHASSRANAALAQERERANTALNHMRQALVMLSADQRVVHFNARAPELLDLPESVLHPGAAFADIRAFQRARGDLALVDGRISERVAGSDLQRLPPTYEWPRPDGKTLEVRGSRLPDGQFVYTFTDVTERKAAQAALQASEARYRLLAENTSDVIIQSDLDTTRRYVSPAARTVLGYAPEALIGTKPLDFVHPDDAAAYEAVLADITLGRSERLVTQQRYRHRDGSWVWIEVSFALMRDPLDGHATGYVASLRDISPRKAAEQAAAESEARYRELKDTTHDAILKELAEGVIVTDASGRITLVNEAAAAIHGVDRLDVEPDAYSETYHLFTEGGLPYPSQDLPLARAVRGERVENARWRVRRPDGTEVLANGSARPLRGQDGGQIGAVLVLRDDTARDAAERSLRDLNATLAERVAERTQEVEAARALAEAGSRAKSDFLAAMSHEIRTPLNGVIGYADLLRDEPGLGPAARLHADRIRSSGAALLTIVNDILDFSKIEAGRIEIQPEPFLVSALIDGAFAIVRGSAEAKDLAVNVTVASEVPTWVSGDKARLRQVLLNLLNNAIKFTHRGWVDLSVAAIAGPGAVRLRFAVSDTGIGIPPDKSDRLFRRFSQADASVSRDFGGTGLGLAISKSLVELMGGSIGFDSVVGQGSTFWFEVPLPVVQPDLRAEEERALPAVATARRLLLAEDVPLNQDLASLILRRAGHVVDIVGDGAEAVAAVRANGYDLVLMDVQMPGVDGLTATRQIRALAGPAGRVPIVALTANVLAQQVAELRAVGMDGHVGKPFRQDALLSAVERWARREGAAPRSHLDPESYRETSRLVGPERMQDMLRILADELDQRFGPASIGHPREQIAEDAHAMIPATSMIGFPVLAETCRAVEEACRSDGDYVQPFENLRALAAETIAEIEALRTG